MKDLNKQKKAVLGLRIVYPLWAVIGIINLLYIPSQLIDKSNPALTAENILNNEWLFRVGIAGSLFTQLISIIAVWFLYRLFYDSFKEPVILTALFNFLGMPITMLSVANQLEVLDVLDKPDLVIALLNQQTYGTVIATIFWGLWLLPQAYMVIKSPLFPKIMGWFLIVAGIGYTLSAFLYFLGFKDSLLMEILDTLTMGEVIWMLWVLIMGARWKALEHH
ncbi:DUF4386 domain-containing protein [Ekhidna sp.]|uniref:DUF4386 domain-containing protein n=1 Tax=Ekhidna sp. TaxID=2608089 RepID=UPI003297D2B8